MPKSIPVVLKRSLIVTAIVSLSACSSMPKMSEIGLSDVGSGIAKAGKATADVSRNAWNKTTYLLGFTDSPDGANSSPSDEQLLIAEVNTDSVQPLTDAPAIDAQNSDRPVLIQQATAATAEQLPQLVDADAEGEAVFLSVSDDVIHEVADNETLWDIAKRTTGNATNWHVLADVNNLGQSATVFPGQQLIIPGDMVKPGYNSDASTAVSEELASVVEIESSDDDGAQNIVDLSGQSNLIVDTNRTRLTIPAPETAEAQLAATEGTLVDTSLNAESFDIEEGETLWDFAKRTTGDATNWEAIASHNQFSEKQATTVRPGQTIFVPEQLVREYMDAATNAEASAGAIVITPVENVDVTAAIPAQEVPAITAATTTAQSAITAALPSVTDLEVQQAETIKLTAPTDTIASIADETQDIKIVEATFKSDDSLEPVTASNESVQMVENDNVPDQIMVSGTYYPKAVYNNADFSSSLLMRVSPGTTLQVSRAMGTWFEVETDKGVGYVHQRDIK